MLSFGFHLWKRSMSGSVTDRARRTRVPFVDLIDTQIGISRKMGCVLFRKLILGFVVTPIKDGFDLQLFWKIGHQVNRKVTP